MQSLAKNHPFIFRFLIGSFIIFILSYSWYIPFFYQIWDKIDLSIAISFNAFFKDKLFLQKIVAFVNSRYGDWSYETIVAFIYIFSAFKKDKEERKKTLFFLLIVIAITVLVQIGVNSIICRKVLSLSRLSPSHVFNLPVDFSVFNFPHNHIFTNHSFPSDRSTTLIICVLFSFSFLKKFPASLILILSIISASSRLIVGAHWMSDIILGGFIISFFIWIITPSKMLHKMLEKRINRSYNEMENESELD
jgi:membrane-associated phospholipid phosphatase